jgi:predicted dehydrogenase
MALKVALLGTGNVARNSYLPYLAQRPGVTLSYLSRTRARAEACAHDFGGTVAGSVEELMAGEPDTVLVLTYETQRYDAARELLAAKPKRVFFEKPLVAMNGQANVTEDDFFKARELLALAADAGTETAMVFNYRFFDQTVRARRVIAEREWGKLRQATLYVNYACWSHCIDLLGLFGGRLKRITALGGGTEYQGAVDVAAAFELESGAVGTILGTSGCSFDLPLYEMLFNFERGLLRFTDLDGPLEIFDPALRYIESHGLRAVNHRGQQYGDSFGKSLAGYLDSVEAGAPPPIPGTAGLEELQFEAALRRSVALGRAVDVATEFPMGL